MIKNNWYVITGGPSVGKTSLLSELAKLGYDVVPEAARTLVDEGLSNGQSLDEIRSDEKKFQKKVAKLKQQIDASRDLHRLTFFDRGMQDTVAYMNYYGFDIPPSVMELMDSSSYKKVFLLEPLKFYSADYARIEDKNFMRDIHDILLDTYSDYKMKPVLIPAVSISERVKIILNEIAS